MRRLTIPVACRCYLSGSLPLLPVLLRRSLRVLSIPLQRTVTIMAMLNTTSALIVPTLARSEKRKSAASNKKTAAAARRRRKALKEWEGKCRAAGDDAAKKAPALWEKKMHNVFSSLRFHDYCSYLGYQSHDALGIRESFGTIAPGPDGDVIVALSSLPSLVQPYIDEYLAGFTSYDGCLINIWTSLASRGYSPYEGACHCRGCRNQRVRIYPGSISAVQSQLMTDWEALNPRPVMVAVDRMSRLIESAQYNRRAVRTEANRAQEKAPATYAAGPTAKGGERRLVGVEVEFNNGHKRAAPKWLETWNGAQIISDGSCGSEAVTPPMAGAHVAKCIKELCDELKANMAGCNSSCGLHVHVDARDMRWSDMLRFLTVYTRIEPFLFLLGGQTRLNQSYCRPAGKSYANALKQEDPKGAVLAVAVLSDSEGYVPAASQAREAMISGQSKKGGGRYKAINIMPWVAGRAYRRADTTVEFRLHAGSHNADRVTRWAWLCADIVDWCINATDADVAALPKSAARCLAIMSPRNKAWIVRRLLGYRKATTASRYPDVNDSGTELPRRAVVVKGGMYAPDASRAYGSGRDDD